MTAAIFGLLGVIVGGLVNGGVGFWARTHNLRNERRVSARLVYEELHAISTALSVGGDHRVALEDMPILTPEWVEHRMTLARSLNHREWAEVSGAYAAVTLLNSSVRGLGLGNQLSEEQASYFESVAEQLDGGLGALKPFSEGWNPKLDRIESPRALRRAMKASERRGI
jgi:hypothetical protein